MTKFLLKCKQLIQGLFLKGSFGNGRGTRLGHRAEEVLAETSLEFPTAELLSAALVGFRALTCFLVGFRAQWGPPVLGMAFSSLPPQRSHVPAQAVTLNSK